MAFRITPRPGLQADIQAAEAVGARLAGELVLQAARATVPIQEGTLERSGRVDVVDDTHVTVGFHTPYATRQHEDLTYRHDRGRRAKYLELAVTENRATIEAILTEQLRRAVT